jgi:hypothetical protein
MKLTKQKLIKAVRTHLEEIGFTFFKTYEEDIVFAKRIRKGLYLTLFLTIHLAKILQDTKLITCCHKNFQNNLVKRALISTTLNMAYG